MMNSLFLKSPLCKLVLLALILPLQNPSLAYAETRPIIPKTPTYALYRYPNKDKNNKVVRKGQAEQIERATLSGGYIVLTLKKGFEIFIQFSSNTRAENYFNNFDAHDGALLADEQTGFSIDVSSCVTSELEKKPDSDSYTSSSHIPTGECHYASIVDYVRDCGWWKSTDFNPVFTKAELSQYELISQSEKPLKRTEVLECDTLKSIKIK